MKFTPASPNENFFMRWTSEMGVYEMGFRQMLFGVRVSVAVVGDCGCFLDYCAGADRAFALELLATLTVILDSYPETIKWYELQKRFPGFTVKPIDRDPYCWTRLQEMAGSAPLSTVK